MKNRRHKMIREIIENNNIETQFQLTDELEKRGFHVTQATVSRDVKELGLVKILTGDNTFKYSFPAGLPTGNIYERAKRMMRDNVLKMVPSDNLLVVRTLPGAAQGVASCIDNLAWQEIIGSVAGDDTILLVVKNKECCKDLLLRLQELAQ